MGIPELLVLAAWLAPAEGVYRYRVSEGILLVAPPVGVHYTMRWVPAPESYRRKGDGRTPLPTAIAANGSQPAPSKGHAQWNRQTSPVASTSGGVRAGAKPVSY
jgi:hypothetical protein